MSLPSFYFLLALAAVIPSGLSAVATFFMIVAIHEPSSVGPALRESSGDGVFCALAPVRRGRRARWAGRDGASSRATSFRR